MADQLEQKSSKAAVGLLALVVGLLLLFVPVAAAQSDDDAYPPSSSSTSTSEATTTTTPSDVETSTLSRDTESGASSLPRTGSEVAPWLITGLVLVAVGGGIIVLTRRHRATT